MRLLFCYSAKGRIDKNNNIYPKTFTDELLKRYYYSCFTHDYSF